MKVRPLLFAFVFASGIAGASHSLISLCAQCGQEAPEVRVPGFTAYVEPDPEAMEVLAPAGVTGWKDAKEKVAWYGYIATPGGLDLAVSLKLPEGAHAQFRLTAANRTLAAQGEGQGAQAVTVKFGSVRIAKAGYYRFGLEGVSRTAETFGDVEALQLSGPAAKAAHFSLVERRNAASVHLGYPLPENRQAEWFYNEVTAKTDPIWTYYEACGFHRGYFGMQVNSPTERRIIFSVWDSGQEALDRSKVAADDRVQLLAKGDGVVASGFGNEGTGGHSHLVYPWKTGGTYQFLVHAEPDGTHTVYSGYFYFPERKQWGLIARFRAPKDGAQMHGLYSFNENFGGANGQLRRLAQFGPAWVRYADGTCQELTTARFTHDPHGKEERKDYGAGVVGDRFYLSNGGFVAEPIQLGDRLERTARGATPSVLLHPEATGRSAAEQGHRSGD